MTEQIGIRTKSGDVLALEGVDATARIAGLLATTTVVQRYVNSSASNLEIAYTFPLPVEAILLSFAACIGERRYVGEVVPRSKAEEKYEQAVESGNSAFRLQAVGKGLYSATLGNVLAGEAVRIELEYAEPLAWNGQSIRYRLPTTLAPRYGEPNHLEPWQRPAVRFDAVYSLAVNVELFGDLAGATVTSPSHPIRLGTDPGKLKVVLADTAAMDRDFILEVHAAGLQSLGIAASGLDAHVAMVTFMPPVVATSAARDTVILLDCSGSMAGDSIRHAKEGVQLALGHLIPSDHFALIGFGSHFFELAPSLQPADGRGLERARRFVTDLGDMGGTEMTLALEAALRYAAERPLDILLLTDGEAWDIERAISHAQGLGTRIFTVGIGAAVAEDTVRTLADRTGGACELVSPNEDMSTRIERHFMRMRQPRISEVDITWPATPLWVTRPERATFAGDAYTVFAAFESPISGEFGATVQYAGGDKSGRSAVCLGSGEALNESIVRVAAATRLPSLPEAARSEWAMRYQLVTDDTDYIVTLARSANERAPTLPDLHIVPHMLAAGWGGTGTVSHSVPPPTSAAVGFLGTESAACFEPSPSFDFGIPAVIRSGSRKSRRSARFEDSPIGEFLNRLSRRANRRILGGLPMSRDELAAMSLPGELLHLVNEAIAGGTDEATVVLSLYAAIRTHEYALTFDEGLGKALDKLLATTRGEQELSARFFEVLEYFRDQYPLQNAPHNIPAFLRKEAD